MIAGAPTINNDEAFDDCVILSSETFDPDAVFLDDIVDDDVLPYPTLEVDGLTTPAENRTGRFLLRPDDVAANDAVQASEAIPDPGFDPELLEVYGWESSFWRKIVSYLGF